MGGDDGFEEGGNECGGGAPDGIRKGDHLRRETHVVLIPSVREARMALNIGAQRSTEKKQAEPKITHCFFPHRYVFLGC